MEENCLAQYLKQSEYLAIFIPFLSYYVIQLFFFDIIALISKGVHLNKSVWILV